MGGEGDAGQLQVVVFSVEGKALAVDILRVREILRMVEITPFPGMPSFALGAINVRGCIVPVIDLRGKLGLPARPPGPRTCIVLVAAATQVVGFLVDEVSEVLDLPSSLLETAGDGPEWMRPEIFAGIGKLPGRMIVVLNPDRLLSPQEEQLLPEALPAEAPREGSATT